MPIASFRSVRTFVALGAIAVATLGVACSDDAEDADAEATSTGTPAATAVATETVPADATTTGPADATQPPADDATLETYSALVEDVTAEFSEATLIEDTGAYEVGGLVGDGRRVLVVGTAAELPSFVEIEQTLRGILEADGWTEDTQYAADGPGSTVSVWTKGEDTAVLAAGVSPQDPGACPADQIIGECLDSLEPSEINVQGSITVANR